MKVEQEELVVTRTTETSVFEPFLHQDDDDSIRMSASVKFLAFVECMLQYFWVLVV